MHIYEKHILDRLINDNLFKYTIQRFSVVRVSKFIRGYSSRPSDILDTIYLQ